MKASAVKSPGEFEWPESPLVVQFALEYESKPFLKRMSLVRRIADAPCDAAIYSAGDTQFVALTTGMGQDCANGALSWLLDQVRPGLVVSAGFAGGLVGGVHPGIVVVADEVIEPSANHWRCKTMFQLLGDNCSEMGGKLISLPTPILNPEEKSRVGWKYQAVAVDVESAAIAELCEINHTPFMCVRAISDSMKHSIHPQVVKLVDGVRASPRRVAALLMTRPWLLLQLIRNWHNSRVAAQKLSVAIARVIESWSARDDADALLKKHIRPSRR